MKQKFVILTTVIGVFLGISGCASSGATVSLDSKNMQKYPAGMVINGYTLPPEPNPKLNNATLLGVDSNHNGIRDDVERFIIISESKNKYYPKIWTAIDLQFAKAEFAFIKKQTPIEAALRLDAQDCQEFFINHGIKKHGFNGLKARRHFLDQYGPINRREQVKMIYRDWDVANEYGRKYNMILMEGAKGYKIVRKGCSEDLTQTGEW